VQRVRQERFDAVLMDIQMPVLDGIEATRQICSCPELSPPPIIAMTAHAMAGDREKYLDAGMVDHVTKPIDKKSLYAALVKWIQPRPGLGASTDLLLAEEGDDAAPLPPWLEEMIGIDVADAMARFDYNACLFRRLLQEFQRDFSGAAGRLRTLLQGGGEGVQEAKRLAHTIRGMAGNLSARSLFVAAEALEKAIQAGQSASWPELLSRFEEGMTTVLQSIAAIPPEQDGPATEGRLPDKNQVHALLEQLGELIENNNMTSLGCFDALKTALGGAMEEESKKLEVSLYQLQFIEAQAALAVLAAALERQE
jgi:two-component system sensor histidine kinase/response regulator